MNHDSGPNNWKNVYFQALQESHPLKLLTLIEAARSLILHRDIALARDFSPNYAERKALDTARRTLWKLEYRTLQ
jgi:hypothetical protein